MCESCNGPQAKTTQCNNCHTTQHTQHTHRILSSVRSVPSVPIVSCIPSQPSVPRRPCYCCIAQRVQCVTDESFIITADAALLMTVVDSSFVYTKYINVYCNTLKCNVSRTARHCTAVQHVALHCFLIFGKCGTEVQCSNVSNTAVHCST